MEKKTFENVCVNIAILLRLDYPNITIDPFAYCRRWHSDKDGEIVVNSFADEFGYFYEIRFLNCGRDFLFIYNFKRETYSLDEITNENEDPIPICKEQKSFYFALMKLYGCKNEIDGKPNFHLEKCYSL